MSNLIRQRINNKSKNFTSDPPPIIILIQSNSSSSASDDDIDHSKSNHSIPIFNPPNFTMKELLGCIPAHCFERSAWKSSLYLIWDSFLSLTLIYCASHINSVFNHSNKILKNLNPNILALFRFLAWSTYAYFSSLVWTGIWVIAHECGHQAFSTSKILNSTIGWILHSLLLVPHFSWKISHAHHHAANGHMTRDQVFIPKTRSQRGLPPLPINASKAERDGTLPASFYQKIDNSLEDAPIKNLFSLFLQQLFGWPAYFLTNASGQPDYPSWTNHFNPNAIIFHPRHRSQVLISGLGVALAMTGLIFFAYKTSFGTLFRFYIVPYLWVNNWLALVTYLQHTDPQLPHYREGAFNFQRGVLCTIDRQIHGFMFHGIAETHMVHHLCSKIPHYHAWEATESLKAKLGPHYPQADGNYWKNLWKSLTQCRFVEDEGDILFYKNAKGQASRRIKNSTTNGSDSGINADNPLL
ncbi:hypothetical protein O181_072193 [Austropuccinia psidii MF-1]|uniref:Fatty acid desaturase domain-containing protein n=1 Tax=Austropuccinia psidii MF-1 TaxID=1389203 RepID=A0A9Q3I8X5_9BASI|nr:hypothetical protein [Austropuccinia psidii MF-1]